MLYLYSLFENLILMRVTLTRTDSRTGKESCNLLTVKALMERVQSPTKADRSNLERYRQAVPLLHGLRAGNEYADRLPLVCPALEYAADGQEVKRRRSRPRLGCFHRLWPPLPERTAGA